MTLAEQIAQAVSSAMAGVSIPEPPKATPKASQKVTPFTAKTAPKAKATPKAKALDGVQTVLDMGDKVTTLTFATPQEWKDSKSGLSQTAYVRVPATKVGNVVLKGGLNLWFKS